MVTDGSYTEGELSTADTEVEPLGCTWETNVTLCVNSTEMKELSCQKKVLFHSNLGGTEFLTIEEFKTHIVAGSMALATEVSYPEGREQEMAC